MRKRNWQQYNKQLVQRGSLTFLIDPKLYKSIKTKHIKKRRGRPQKFSDPLIVMLMMVKIHYRLPYRALEGFAKSVVALGKKFGSIPSYSLICKRARMLEGVLPRLSSRRPSVILIDASGVKIYGEGEWKVKIHGKGRPRKWLKIHIAIDAQTQEIVAEATTESNISDGKMLESLLDQTQGSAEVVMGDGAYDGKECRRAIHRKKARALVPPPKNARVWGRDANRDDAVRIIRGFGGDKQAKSLWGKMTGYNRRVLVEAAFSRMKRLFGDRLFSKTPDKQAVENRLRCLLLNKMIGVGI